MKNIFTSKWHGCNESTERIHVYEFDNEEEFWEFEDMTFEEKCDLFDVRENIPIPGGVYRKYCFYNTVYHAVMFEYKSMDT